MDELLGKYEQWRQVAEMWFVPDLASVSHIAKTVKLPFNTVVVMIDILRTVHPVMHKAIPEGEVEDA